MEDVEEYTDTLPIRTTVLLLNVTIVHAASHSLIIFQLQPEFAN